MKKKYLYSIIIILLCISYTNINASNINYNLRIDKNLHFYETITYNVEKSDIKENGNYNFLTSIVNDPIYFDLKEEVRYKKNKVSTNTGYLVTLKHDYSYIFLSKSRILNECFVNKSFNNNNQHYLAFQASGFYCSHRADNIKVTINTDLNVISSNAHSTNNNTYIWDNVSNNLSINFKVEIPNIESDPMDETDDDDIVEDNDENKKEENNKNNNGYIFLIIFSTIGISLIIAFIVLKRKKDKLDEI